MNSTLKSLPLLFMLLCTLVACSNPGEPLIDDTVESGKVQILYRGITQDIDGTWAEFTLVNDSTELLSYFAYDANHPHYSTEMLSDSGWTWLFWNWCGTGAEYFPLESGGRVDFKTSLPHIDCTWRVLVGATCNPDSGSFMLRSRSIDYATSN